MWAVRSLHLSRLSNPRVSVSKSVRESSQPNGFSLAKLELRTPQDVVTLSRRTRAAGEEFGLPPRTIRNLSAATYETAMLMSVRMANAEVRLADGPSLQVVLHVPHADSPLPELHARLVEAVAPLRSMVDEVEITENGTELSVCLRVLFPVGAAARIRPLTLTAEAGRDHSEPDDEAPDALRQEHGQLTRAFRELQLELQETNRGVVALHAELEANADKLRQAEDRLRLLLDSVQDYAICMLTPEGEIASWNSGAERLFA